MIHKRKLTGVSHSVHPGSTAPSTTAGKANIWAALSYDEAASVKDYLHKQPSLNLTAAEDAGEWDNHILVVDTIVPNKTDALAYLDGSGAQPDRWALASIVFGQYEEPYVQTFAVGPLPISNKTAYFPNTFQSTAPDAKIRVHDQTASGPYIREVALQMKDILSDLLYTPIETAQDLRTKFYMWGIDPLWHEDGKVLNWVQIWRNSDMVELPSGGEFKFDDGTLLPQGIYLGFDVTGRDTSKWSLIGIFYGGEYYQTIDAFRAAWEAPGFVKHPQNFGGAWSATDKTVGAELPYDTLPPPQQVQPGGQRFELDKENGYVKWMDFEFYTTFTRDTGIRFYDIKYKGERIMYELGLQEAIAHYAGESGR
jgi:primary-amine oxidase